MADLNPILEDTNSIVEESVDSEHSDINYSKEEESQQNDNRSTENEKKNWRGSITVNERKKPLPER